MQTTRVFILHQIKIVLRLVLIGLNLDLNFIIR